MGSRSTSKAGHCDLEQVTPSSGLSEGFCDISGHELQHPRSRDEDTLRAHIRSPTYRPKLLSSRSVLNRTKCRANSSLQDIQIVRMEIPVSPQYLGQPAGPSPQWAPCLILVLQVSGLQLPLILQFYLMSLPQGSHLCASSLVILFDP